MQRKRLLIVLGVALAALVCLAVASLIHQRMVDLPAAAARPGPAPGTAPGRDGP
jgi:hypothetical protein